VTTASLSLGDASGATAGSVSAVSATATFVPASPLHVGSTYTANLSTVIADASGNHLAAPARVVFTVAMDTERQAFMTSVSGTGDLSSWADAGGARGLAAADAICQARAAAAGFDGRFVAWLSDGTDDAYCRVHGLGGQRAAQCGQSALPAAAGPWVRSDGLPWGDRIDLLLDATHPRVYTPPGRDEFGAPVTREFFTATSALGAFDGPESCSGWTSASGGTATAGEPDYAGGEWSIAAHKSCGGAQSLFCLEVGPGVAPTFPTPTGRRAFLTSVAGTGDLSSWPDAQGQMGLAAGDAICRARATAAGLPNAASYTAWLSAGATAAGDRLSADGPWVRVDGVPLAASRDALRAGALVSSLNVTETGEYLWLPLFAWTGTSSGGGAGAECGAWSGMGNGITGRIYQASALWTQTTARTPDACTRRYPLYCFED
jgi:hypothetical protein